MSITSILQIETATDYKIHAARWNGESQPLDVYLRDKKEWHNWNQYFGKKHEFNRPYILALADFYPERHIWLFGGIYRVENYDKRPPLSKIESHAYTTQLTAKGAELIGRLKIRARFSRNRTFKLEGQIENLKLEQVLRTPYTGPGFPGYDRASLTYTELCSIIHNDRQDWKTALINMKGIYLITLKDGKHYVGSAYGDTGIWSRWANYALTKDGGNAEMRTLNTSTEGLFIEGARFTLLESWPVRTNDSHILSRETYWKVALSSREHGINNN